MTDLLFLIGPGAFTFMVAAKLSGKTADHLVSALTEWVSYCMIDMGLVWLIEVMMDNYGKTEAEASLSYPVIEMRMVWISLAAAFLVGVLASFFKLAVFQTMIDRERPGFFEKMGSKGRKLVRFLVGLVCMASILALILLPRIQVRIREQADAAYKAKVRSIYTQIQDALEEELKEGTPVDDLEDILLEDITVKRVFSDQKWKQESGVAKEEAVYMVDGTGKLVYYSFRNAIWATTWSGATEDQEFLSRVGSWNKGRGYGWSGHK